MLQAKQRWRQHLSPVVRRLRNSASESSSLWLGPTGRTSAAPVLENILNLQEDYAGKHPVAARLEGITKLTSMAMGSPEKAAKVMFEAATGSGEAGELIKRENLLRVIIGPDCWKVVDKKISELRRTTDLLEVVAASTNI